MCHVLVVRAMEGPYFDHLVYLELALFYQRGYDFPLDTAVPTELRRAEPAVL